MYVSSSMVFERAELFPTPEDYLPQCPTPELRLRLLQAHRRGLLPRRPRRARPARTRSAARSTPTAPASCPTRRAGDRARRARPDRTRCSSGQRPLQIFGSGEQTRTLTHVDDIADGIVTAMGSPAGAERGLQHLRLARADRRRDRAASSGRHAARTRTSSSSSTCRRFDGRRPAPLAVGREGAPAARLGGADRG